MKVLLDTHIFLWYIAGDSHCLGQWKEIIRNPDNEIFLSVVSLWESIVKYRLGKLPLPKPPQIFIPYQRDRHNITSLDLDETSVIHLAQLPLIHRDPFDRMLICQALDHQLSIITADQVLHAYPVNVIR